MVVVATKLTELRAQTEELLSILLTEVAEATGPSQWKAEILRSAAAIIKQLEE